MSDLIASNTILTGAVSQTLLIMTEPREGIALSGANSEECSNEVEPKSDYLIDPQSSAKSERDRELAIEEVASLSQPSEQTTCDSGVAVETASDNEEQSEDCNSELDLSGILADLSPIPQTPEDAQITDPANPLPISDNQSCDIGQNDDQSLEGSEDESPAMPYEHPPGDIAFEQSDLPTIGAKAEGALANPPNPPFEPLTPEKDSEPSTSSQPSAQPMLSYDSSAAQFLIDGSVGALQTGLQTFLQSAYNPSQAVPEVPSSQLCNVLRREPTNDERILFLRGCSPAVLWHFVLNCLSQPLRYGKVCSWTGTAWEWRITNTKRFTEQWDECNMNRQAVSYVKVSRALKSFESTQFRGLTLMKRVASNRNAFRFLPDHDSSLIPFDAPLPDIPYSPAQCPVPQQSSYLSPSLSSLLTADASDTIESGHYSHFGIPPQLRMPLKRGMYMRPTEQQSSRSIKNSRLDFTQSQFPMQMYTSTPIRNAPTPITAASFGRELTNTDGWTSPYVSFSPVSSMTGQAQWPNSSVYQSNYPFWTYPTCPLPYQFADSSSTSSGYTGLPSREQMGWVASTPSMYVNQCEFGSVNGSDDSGVYEDTRSARTSYHSTPYSQPFSGDGRRTQIDRENVFEGNAYP